MTFDLSGVMDQSYKQALRSMPAKNCTPIDPGGPKAVYTEIDWALYGGSTARPNIAVKINLEAQTVANPLDSIRTVYIDNTFSEFPVYVYFPDTRFVAVAPANSIAMVPVVTGLLQAIVYIEGLFNNAVPTTTVHFMNYDRNGFVINSAFENTARLRFYTQAANETASNFYTNNIGIGPAQSDRLVVIPMISYYGSPAPLAFVSVTFGGTPMIQATTYGQPGFSATNYHVAAIYYLKVPSGISGVLNVTLSAIAQGFFASVYTITNQQSDTPISISANGNSEAEYFSITLDSLNGASGVFASSYANAATNYIPQWDNATLTAYNFHQVASEMASSAYAQRLRSGPIMVGSQASLLVGALWR